MVRRLPVLQQTPEASPVRSPRQWIAIQALVTVVVWLPTAGVTLRLGPVGPALSFAAAAVLGGYLARRFAPDPSPTRVALGGASAAVVAGVLAALSAPRASGALVLGIGALAAFSVLGALAGRALAGRALAGRARP